MQLVREPDLVRVGKMVTEAIQDHPNQAHGYTDVSHTINMLLDCDRAGCLIAAALEDNGEYVGVVVATVGASIHSPTLEASEHVLWVRKSHRSLSAVTKLIRAFSARASELGAKILTIADTSGHDPRLSILYKRAGFLPQGGYYGKEI